VLDLVYAYERDDLDRRHVQRFGLEAIAAAFAAAVTSAAHLDRQLDFLESVPVGTQRPF